MSFRILETGEFNCENLWSTLFLVCVTSCWNLTICKIYINLYLPVQQIYLEVICIVLRFENCHCLSFLQRFRIHLISNGWGISEDININTLHNASQIIKLTFNKKISQYFFLFGLVFLSFLFLSSLPFLFFF